MENEKLINKSLYTLDKLVLEFMLRTSDAQKFMDKLSGKVNISSQISNKRAVCRFSYYIDLDDSNSFYIGFEPNWKPFDAHIKYGRIEFNPAKVSENLEFQALYFELMKYISNRGILGNKAVPVRFDLAIDLPVSRDRVFMLKDNRTYKEYSNSLTDRTQYLGKHNNHGFVKVYNKAMELKLNGVDLTRLEVTVDYFKRSAEEVQKLIPKMYLLDSFQFPLGINGTDMVLLTGVMHDFQLLKVLPHVKRKKIEGYLEHTLLSLQLDNIKYNHVLDCISSFVDYNISFN